MKSQFNPWLGLAAFVVLTFAAAALGALFTSLSVGTWYTTLRRPSWTPPDWVFGPVWSVLYLSMAVAAWLVWRQHGLASAAWPLGLFAVQIALNVVWSALFFALRNPGAALFEIIFLWCAILATALSFWRISVPAGWLLVPYLAWVTYAAALNFAFWRMNP